MSSLWDLDTQRSDQPLRISSALRISGMTLQENVAAHSAQVVQIRHYMPSRFALVLGVLTALCITARCHERFDKPAASGEVPAGSVRGLIVADEESAKLSPERWPDLSLEGLRAREALDRATLDKLHAVARNDLTGEDRTIYDLFEWRLNRRLEQFRLRLYLTPFWDDDRFVGFAGVLGMVNTLSGASQKKVETFPAYVNQAVALLREGIHARMLPSGDRFDLFLRDALPLRLVTILGVPRGSKRGRRRRIFAISCRTNIFRLARCPAV